jgi:uncharacterized membrane protein YedE/YeeE
MKHFEVGVGVALITLSFLTLAIWIGRATRRRDLDGIHFVYFSNIGMGVFLLTYGLSWYGGIGALILIGSAIVGFGSGIALMVSMARSSKDPFR